MQKIKKESYTIKLSPTEIKILKGAKHILLNLAQIDENGSFFTETLGWTEIDDFDSIGIMLEDIIYHSEQKRLDI